MGNFAKNTKLAEKLLKILPVLVLVLLIADALYIRRFNSIVYAVDGNAGQGESFLNFEARGGNGGGWIKRDVDLNGEKVNLNAQTFDGTVTNNAKYQIRDWYFTLRIKSDCFVNSAWCGTMEIQQNTADGEKVQRVDLRNDSIDRITLDHLVDNGDLLVFLRAGDTVIYHPSEENFEYPVLKGASVTIGFILYSLDGFDLSDYTLHYQYHQNYTDCPLFWGGMAATLAWLLLLGGYLISRISYQAAKREMEMKKSGISAMSEIYSIIYIIDLVKNELIPVVADKESERLRPKDMNAQNQLKNLFEWDCVDIYRNTVLNFCDLDTIRDRLNRDKTAVCEYISRTHGWCQLRFFTMERDERGETEKVIFAIQVIDKEKAELESLHAAVKEKTQNILDIQQKVVVGLANIIEDRDTNTGSHVKRTSDIIAIIVDEIRKQNMIPIDNDFAMDIVRAAPMHDLGKISIDSSILCKPGRLTKEEYDIMKTHSPRSGEMVKLLLDGIEEEKFVKTAFNIARYHHERWDGKGYPDGLSGEQIPIEARIMAIADVYDALVSKRCYKEPMSFEQASGIMLEGMGTQFDPQMKEVFLGCRDKLEAYCKGNN